VPAVGSGPFKLVEWNEGQFWTLEKQPGYWGGEPTIDKIIYRVYDRSESMVQALKAGEIDSPTASIPTSSAPWKASLGSPPGRPARTPSTTSPSAYGSLDSGRLQGLPGRDTDS